VLLAVQSSAATVTVHTVSALSTTCKTLAVAVVVAVVVAVLDMHSLK
jgi:hypothetical protein